MQGYMFLVDRSGSMTGMGITMAKQTEAAFETATVWKCVAQNIQLWKRLYISMVLGQSKTTVTVLRM